MTHSIQLYTQFSDWLQTNLGKKVLKAESQLLQPIWENLSGQSLLLIGSDAQIDLIQSHRFKQSALLSPLLLDSTPVNYDSFDTIILPHTLELVDNPFSLLQKTTKALRADGHLIILHFNPWSLWGLFRLFSFQKQKMPYALKHYSSLQIKNWLNTLSFETEIVKSCFYQLPTDTSTASLLSHFLESIQFPFFSNIRLYIAKKKTIALTPLKVRWKPLSHWALKNWKPAPTEGSYHRE